jgi:DNA-binding NarL/FixJ family response regulator
MRLPAPQDLEKLTEREWEVAKLVGDGFDNTVIGKELGIQRGVVANTLGRIYMKLNMNTWSGYNIRVVLSNVVNAVKAND